MTCFPVSVEPVNVIESTSGCPARAEPAEEPGPVTTLNTPGGNPTVAAISASFNALSGVREAGFSTTVFPAARAGAIPRHARTSG